MSGAPCKGSDALGLALLANGTLAYADRSPSAPCAACALRKSKSQWREDRLVMADLAVATDGFERPGTFVEIGALDGVTFSNTHLYELCFGWSGVLIEANVHNYLRLRKSGRTRSAFVHSAICATESVVNMTKKGDGVAAQVNVMSAAFRKRWHSGSHLPVDEVPCRPMSAILAEHGLAKGGTFLSLDVVRPDAAHASHGRQPASHTSARRARATHRRRAPRRWCSRPSTRRSSASSWSSGAPTSA